MVMNRPTSSEKAMLLFLSATLLLGMGVSYYRKSHPPFSLKVVSSSEALEKEEVSLEKSKQVSLNQGTEEDFARLPHVGPELSKRIVAYRNARGFQKKEDLLEVKGIGAKTYETLEELLVIE